MSTKKSRQQKRDTENAARSAQEAANETTRIRTELEAQTKLEKEKATREKVKAQRLLMRSLRAGSGGYFETDSGSQLGGSGVVG